LVRHSARIRQIVRSRYHDPVRYVALLRGINVGGRTIKMAELKAFFEGSGFDDVKTILQSGNVIFESAEKLPSLKKEIETGLSDRFAYSAHVQIYSLVKLKRIVDASPFEGDAATHSYVVFFEKGLEKQLADEAGSLDDNTESIHVGDGVIYWTVSKGSTLESDFAQYLSKSRYKSFHTSRNLNTLRKIIVA
jgi:uncharacterized protein (DUF1697 family)